jgi:glycine/D-amino acid oxidase-like deaminating enzyme
MHLLRNLNKLRVHVIGGGLHGTRIAFNLLRKGHDVTVYEAGDLQHQGARQWPWGFVRYQGRPPSQLPATFNLQENFQLMLKEMGISKDSIGYRQDGNLLLADSLDKLNGYKSWLAMSYDVAQRHNVTPPESELLSPHDLRKRFPLLCSRKGFYGGLFTPSDAQCESNLLQIEMAASLRQQFGADRYLENTSVIRVNADCDRVISLITTSDEIDVTNAKVIFAAGNGTRKLVQPFVPLPIQKLTLPVAMVSKDVGIPDYLPFWAKDISGRSTADGGFIFAPGSNSFFNPLAGNINTSLPYFLRALYENYQNVQLSLGDPDVHTLLSPALNELTELHDCFKSIKRFSHYSCDVDTSPDMNPIIGKVPGILNGYLLTAFSGSGLGLLGASGLHTGLTHLMETGVCLPVLNSFLPQRFSLLNCLMPSKTAGISARG